jgi:hypothetical protein
MPIANDARGDPDRSLDSKDSGAPSFGLALEKLREASLQFERARRRADEELPAARQAEPANDDGVDAIRRALLVEMFRVDISRRAR